MLGVSFRNCIATLLMIAVVCFVSPLPAAAQLQDQVAKVKRSSVYVAILSRQGKFQGHGSGTVIGEGGYILTNEHVAGGAPLLGVIRAGEPLDSAVPARLIWADKSRDIALIHAPDLKAPALSIATAILRPAQAIATMGFPGLTATKDISNPTTTTGSVAKLDNFHTNAGTPIPFIYYDILTSGGNSGGPVFDECGRMVGIHAFGRTDPRTGAKINGGYPIGDALQRLRTDPGSRNIRINTISSVCPAGGAAAAAAANARAAAANARAAAASANEKAEQLQKDLAEAEAAQKLEAEEQRALMEQQKETQTRVFIGMGAGMLGLGGLTVFALVMAMKKPRRAFIRSMSRMVGMDPGPAAAPVGGGVRPPVRGGGVPSASSGGDMNSTAYSGGGYQSAGANNAQPPPVGTPMSVVLSGFDDSGHPLRFEIDGRYMDTPNGLSFGRSIDFVNHMISGAEVSKRHFRVLWSGSKYLVEDLNSTNGTIINGNNIGAYNPQPLNFGDQISIGQLRLDVSRG